MDAKSQSKCSLSTLGRFGAYFRAPYQWVTLVTRTDNGATRDVLLLKEIAGQPIRTQEARARAI
jgi:hypothetical protein